MVALAAVALGKLAPLERPYKILMLLPVGSKSHKGFFTSVADALGERGHKVRVPKDERVFLRALARGLRLHWAKSGACMFPFPFVTKGLKLFIVVGNKKYFWNGQSLI